MSTPVPGSPAPRGPADELARRIVADAAAEFRRYKSLADRAIAQVDDDKLRRPLDLNTNSIAVIMKHVSGNLLSRWTDFLTTDGEKPWRDRDGEFIDDFPSRAAAVDAWERGWRCLFASLTALSPSDLNTTVFIRGEAHSVTLAIERSLAHVAYHVGQIVLLARVLAGDRWETLTIPRGGTRAFNEGMGYRQDRA